MRISCTMYSCSLSIRKQNKSHCQGLTDIKFNKFRMILTRRCNDVKIIIWQWIGSKEEAVYISLAVSGLIPSPDVLITSGAQTNITPVGPCCHYITTLQ